MRASQVAAKSKDVHIDSYQIKEFCNAFKRNKNRYWLSKAPCDLLRLPPDERLAFLFVLDSISFSYWGRPKWTVGYGNRSYDGSWAMVASIANARKSGIPVLEPGYLADLSSEGLERVLSGNVKIPLHRERLGILHELGQVMLQKYQGNFRNVVDEARGKASGLCRVLVSEFASFDDTRQHEGKLLCFHKRAQLLASDIAHMFLDDRSLAIEGVEELSACADYKLPQVLRRHGIILYSEELAGMVDNEVELPAGDPKEIEIRASSIYAVELIRYTLQASFTAMDSMEINDYLWLEGQLKLPEDKPYHRTRTTDY